MGINMFEIELFELEPGHEPFNDFLDAIKSYDDRARIQARLDRVEKGNLGDYVSVGDGVYELRFFFGPGYRVYFGIEAKKIILLLCGGDKRSQKKDIKQAKNYWQFYKEAK